MTARYLTQLRKVLLGSKKTQLGFLSSTVVVAIVCGAGFLPVSGGKNVLSESTSISPAGEQATISPDPSEQVKFVRKAAIWPKLRETLSILGDRLEKPGNERLVMTGSIKRESVSRPFKLVTEFPEKARLEEQIGPQRQVTIFNGRELSKSDGNIGNSDQDLIELLVFDSIEHFFIGQMQGLSTRTLGERFRLDDGTSETYDSGFYDIYLVDEPTELNQTAAAKTKLYYFNSDSLLLEMIKYQLDRGGNSISVEVQLKDWRTVVGQSIPHSITQMHDGINVLELKIDSINTGPAVKDGLFDVK